MNNLTIVTEVVTPCRCPIVATFQPTLYSAQLHDFDPLWKGTKFKPAWPMRDPQLLHKEMTRTGHGRDAAAVARVVTLSWDVYGRLNRRITRWPNAFSNRLSSSLCAICSQQVACHGSPSFSILCHSDIVIIWHFCPFLDVIRPHCSRSPSSSSTIYPSFHQQSLYPISSYYMSKILTFPFFDSI